MVLVDKKILVSGIAMVIVGISFSVYFDTVMPVGIAGMSEKDTINLLQKQQENQNMKTLTGILSGVGFLLVLISFGARKKRKGGTPKTVEKKPAK